MTPLGLCGSKLGLVVCFVLVCSRTWWQREVTYLVRLLAARIGASRRYAKRLAPVAATHRSPPAKRPFASVALRSSPAADEEVAFETPAEHRPKSGYEELGRVCARSRTIDLSTTAPVAAGALFLRGMAVAVFAAQVLVILQS